MAMKLSTKSICFVVGVLLMMASTHFLIVEGRVLRSEEEKLADMKERMEGVKPIVLVDEANSLSSSSRSSFRSLSFVLASGPSKKGPGH
ncbi:hypothetical protein Csa_012906 [Cucumis sativus]|uniref:Uncharacterized protein n=1 Tax=Cucumis sativus TaxID=3659 RepID=A0A0A0KZV6_CUCSA|nr:hypothetical protein Csa_012906 [Cucumis sativus]